MKSFKELIREDVPRHPLSTMIKNHPGVHPLQVDPAVKHALTNKDRDVDGDVDKYDRPKSKVPDEIPVGSQKLNRVMTNKYAGELKHIHKGIAYEHVIPFGEFIDEGVIEEDFVVTGEELYEDWGEPLEEAEYQGRKVKLGKPFLTPDGPKKRAVYVQNDKGNVVKVNFGDPNMKIKKNIPARRKSFRARHHCDTNPGPRHKARYWSCKAW